MLADTAISASVERLFSAAGFSSLERRTIAAKLLESEANCKIYQRITKNISL